MQSSGVVFELASNWKVSKEAQEAKIDKKWYHRSGTRIGNKGAGKDSKMGCARPIDRALSLGVISVVFRDAVMPARNDIEDLRA